MQSHGGKHAFIGRCELYSPAAGLHIGADLHDPLHPDPCREVEAFERVKVAVTVSKLYVRVVVVNRARQRFWCFGPGQFSASARVSSDRKSTRLNSSHVATSYAVFCLKIMILINTTQSDETH